MNDDRNIAVILVFMFVFSMWLLEVGLRVKSNYTELHRRVKLLEGYHK